jgi:hypothetical protein
MPKHQEQAGGSGTTGQTTTGEATRKLTKPEAGYREDQGIAGLRCGECTYFEDGACQIVEGRIDEDDVCDEFEPNTKDGSMTATQATEERQRPLSTLEMWITRVSQDKRGVRRWYATSSGVKKDLYGERMTTALFDDFVRRIDEGEEAPAPFISEAWNGGNPYLGVAHFLDLDGFGIVGPTERVWRDGKILKMKGKFEDTPIAEASFHAIQQDRIEKRADEQRVRVSIAFVDWGHNHGDGKDFTRKSLQDACMLCEAGVPDKEYTAGHLVHLALTRRPAYPETEIVALEEKSMSKRRDDAESIIGKELADELEQRQKELIGRADDGDSKVAAGAVVIKDESAGEEATSEVERTLGGAQTLDEAEAFLAKSNDGEPVLLDSWGVLASVLTNVSGEEHREPIREVLRDFQSTLDVQTAEAVLEIRRALGGETVTEETEEAEAVERQVPPQFRKDEEEDQERERRPEEEEVEGEAEEEPAEDEDEDEEEEMEEKSVHVLDGALAQVREAFDDAMATPGDAAMRLGMIQESVSGLGAEITAQMQSATASAPVDAATISRVVEKAVQPIAAAVGALQAQVQAGATETSSRIPGRRAMRMPPVTNPSLQPVERVEPEAPSDDNPTPGLRKLIRRTTVGYERARGR